MTNPNNTNDSWEERFDNYGMEFIEKVEDPKLSEDEKDMLAYQEMKNFFGREIERARATSVQVNVEERFAKELKEKFYKAGLQKALDVKPMNFVDMHPEEDWKTAEHGWNKALVKWEESIKKEMNK